MDPDSDPDPGSGSCCFRYRPSRCQQKTNLFYFFCLLLFEETFTSFFKDKKSKSHKIVGIKVFLTIFARSRSGSIPLTNGSVSGSRRPKIMWIRCIRIRNTACQSVLLNYATVTNTERLDQGHLHPSIKHTETDMSRPGLNLRPLAPPAGALPKSYCNSLCYCYSKPLQNRINDTQQNTVPVWKLLRKFIKCVCSECDNWEKVNCVLRIQDPALFDPWIRDRKIIWIRIEDEHLR
jgi:hypothetical protein